MAYIDSGQGGEGRNPAGGRRRIRRRRRFNYTKSGISGSVLTLPPLEAPQALYIPGPGPLGWIIFSQCVECGGEQQVQSRSGLKCCSAWVVVKFSLGL